MKKILFVVLLLMVVLFSSQSSGGSITETVEFNTENEEWQWANYTVGGWNLIRGRVIGEPKPFSVITVEYEIEPHDYVDTPEHFCSIGGGCFNKYNSSYLISYDIEINNINQDIYFGGYVSVSDLPYLTFHLKSMNGSKYNDYLESLGQCGCFCENTNNTDIVTKNDTMVIYFNDTIHHWYDSSTNNTVENNLSTIQNNTILIENDYNDTYIKWKIADYDVLPKRVNDTWHLVMENENDITELRQNVTQNRVNFELSGQQKDRDRIKRLEDNQTQLKHDRDLLMEQIESLKSERDVAKKQVTTTSAVSSAFMMVSLLVIWRMKKK